MAAACALTRGGGVGDKGHMKSPGSMRAMALGMVATVAVGLQAAPAAGRVLHTFERQQLTDEIGRAHV